jgi:zona occludens toxin (predicted ATPase)
LQIKFLKNFNGSDDGIKLKRFKAEGIYNIPSDLGLELANIAINNKYAIQLSEEKQNKIIEESDDTIIEEDDAPEEQPKDIKNIFFNYNSKNKGKNKK